VNNGDCDPRVVTAARLIDPTLAWPGRPGLEQVVDYDTSAAGLISRGRTLFAHCMTCHQANGAGLPPLYPPLDESPYVTGDPERLARILLHGLQGRIDVLGKTYDQSMPAAPFKKDADIAAIMSYIRQAWDNDADPVTPEFVAGVREATKDRLQPWTAGELGE
jgi:mono/diheme cytochrome c family protein